MKVHEEDIPLVETFPVGFVCGLSLMWLAVWACLFVLIRAELTSLMLCFGSMEVPWWLPWVLPPQLLLLACALLALTRGGMWKYRAVGGVLLTVIILLAVSLPSTSSAILRYTEPSDYDPLIHTVSRLSVAFIKQSLDHVLTLLLALPVCIVLTRRLFIRKYKGLKLSRPSVPAAASGLMLFPAVFLYVWFGFGAGWFFWACGTILIYVLAHRKTLIDHLRAEGRL